MVSIADNSYYQILVDGAKNRIYMKILGVWEKYEQVAGFIPHVQKALSYVTPGFTVISDIRELEECSIEVQYLHVEAQKCAIEAGLHQLAEIHKLNDPVSELSIALAQESKISLNIFENQEDAEAWLDEL